jgi:hypothetical protein
MTSPPSSPPTPTSAPPSSISIVPAWTPSQTEEALSALWFIVALLTYRIKFLRWAVFLSTWYALAHLVFAILFAISRVITNTP